MDKQLTAREWLRSIGYSAVAEKIEVILAIWKEKGVSTRRDWWEVLAGTKSGRPKIIEGIEFPVFRGARERQGYPAVPNAIGPSAETHSLQIWEVNRWSS